MRYLESFEICDGCDNDGDGNVDETPSDCTTCLAEGVCAAGFQQVCVSGALECQYTSSDFEEVEQICDGEDNDCDGELDEGDGCCMEATDCDDSDACTTDECVDHACRASLT